MVFETGVCVTFWEQIELGENVSISILWRVRMR